MRSGTKCRMGPAVAHGHSQALRIADNDVRPHFPRGRGQRHGKQIRANRDEDACFVGYPDKLRQVAQNAPSVW